MPCHKDTKELFDFIVANSEAEYISDLQKGIVVPQSVLDAITMAIPERYTLNEWNNLYRYMLQGKKSFSCREAAKKQLLKELKGQNLF